MTKPFPALCKDCQHSKPQTSATWNLLCLHPIVNADDPWALAHASTSDAGSSCKDQRARKWFAPCGMKGKLWEPKSPAAEGGAS